MPGSKRPSPTTRSPFDAFEAAGRAEALHHVEQAWEAQQRLVRRCLHLQLQSSSPEGDAPAPGDVNGAAGVGGVQPLREDDGCLDGGSASEGAGKEAARSGLMRSASEEEVVADKPAADETTDVSPAEKETASTSKDALSIAAPQSSVTVGL